MKQFALFLPFFFFVHKAVVKECTCFLVTFLYLWKMICMSSTFKRSYTLMTVLFKSMHLSFVQMFDWIAVLYEFFYSYAKRLWTSAFVMSIKFAKNYTSLQISWNLKFYIKFYTKCWKFYLKFQIFTDFAWAENSPKTALTAGKLVQNAKHIEKQFVGTVFW